jgi:hypothetical protein
VEERSLNRGDEDEFLVHGEKKGRDREVAGDYSIPYITTFLLLGMDRGAAEVALSAVTGSLVRNRLLLLLLCGCA